MVAKRINQLKQQEQYKMNRPKDLQKGDHSTLATIPATLQQSAKLLVKEDCILAGVELAEYIFKYYDKDLTIDVKIKDGEQAKVGDVAFIVTGSAQSHIDLQKDLY
ncbi:hypothetical protein FQR65_LT16224 [Abscondita terminalis]|nr:hypothetical protein FQR65_LT16224 [Abscondita terminalis]